MLYGDEDAEDDCLQLGDLKRREEYIEQAVEWQKDMGVHEFFGIELFLRNACIYPTAERLLKCEVREGGEKARRTRSGLHSFGCISGRTRRMRRPAAARI